MTNQTLLSELNWLHLTKNINEQDRMQRTSITIFKNLLLVVTLRYYYYHVNEDDRL